MANPTLAHSDIDNHISDPSYFHEPVNTFQDS